MNKNVLIFLACIVSSHAGLAMNNQDDVAPRNHHPASGLKSGTEDESFSLGMIKFRSRNFDAALPYLKKASEDGNPDAAYPIGMIFEFHYQNFKEAETWYALAEKNGDKDAPDARERLSEKMQYPRLLGLAK